MEINNLTNFSVNEKIFSTVAKNVLKGENRKTETISLAFVDKKEIRKLNKKFRKKDKATDVLSFELLSTDSAEGYLGEIIICPEVVEENAKKYREQEKDAGKKELMKVFVHGILHLCGYDHERGKAEEKVMEEKQNFYLSKIKF